MLKLAAGQFIGKPKAHREQERDNETDTKQKRQP